ncbi:hypothetical protein [Candidatus Nitrosotalea okcheonensis]|uniref:Uncharacterized protein n=1 Tax=Candidatus Nitrosotalea okcheonensis TaxID=1903276 RepID=A0A2H1FI16_9ARCH|nr:hypothetical protein [Candidatus Nitrosotalea okcheonensis]MDE1727764.1 hypothetical protein [Nitrososphaerota archaeon]MDE1831766.1 hypothetical protein [Nitrososphaerota archaeon]MDE1840598.1 hypothetical protein [Nitrososphaerota archaeon]MDE1877538.1 hypothetical protein [Nitrososphaerota archaeon]SMH72405.1 conserved membrane protein of unknown function [Candidatus Nitrosotalea okcheonensis]
MLHQILLAIQGSPELGGELPALPESLDFASGIFAAFLFALSLFAYRRTNLKRLLFVSAAFGLYSIRAVLPRMDIILPNLQITTIADTLISILGFVILGLFFLAIVKKN